MEKKDIFFLLLLFILIIFLFNNNFFSKNKYSYCSLNNCPKGYVCCPGNLTKNICVLPEECLLLKERLKEGLSINDFLEEKRKPFVIRNITLSNFWFPLLVIIAIIYFFLKKN